MGRDKYYHVSVNIIGVYVFYIILRLFTPIKLLRNIIAVIIMLIIDVMKELIDEAVKRYRKYIPFWLRDILEALGIYGTGFSWKDIYADLAGIVLAEIAILSCGI